MKLGVNIDHIATVRQARGTIAPEPVQAALLAEEAGAHGITVHLREDRRHIQDRDVKLLSETIQTKLNFEMAVTDEMISICKDIKPACCCLVPEKREELTTEGGLDVIGNLSQIKAATTELQSVGIEVSLFIDPDLKQIDAAKECGAKAIEIHTGEYSEFEDYKLKDLRQKALSRIITAVDYGNDLGFIVNAGHGLNYHNVSDIAKISGINELNIGHSIIARALMVGMTQAVLDMLAQMEV
jgi:pyridoxine 5-phosphate synthase